MMRAQDTSQGSLSICQSPRCQQALPLHRRSYCQKEHSMLTTELGAQQQLKRTGQPALEIQVVGLSGSRIDNLADLPRLQVLVSLYLSNCITVTALKCRDSISVLQESGMSGGKLLMATAIEPPLAYFPDRGKGVMWAAGTCIAGRLARASRFQIC